MITYSPVDFFFDHSTVWGTGHIEYLWEQSYNVDQEIQKYTY